jgi:hypothetical protein
MSLRSLLEWRRRELCAFFEALFGPRWRNPAAYATSVPICLFTRLRTRPLSAWTTLKNTDPNGLNPNDVFRAEEAATALGFKPTSPSKGFSVPKPTGPRPGSFPAIHERYRDWKRERSRMNREHERRSKAKKARSKLGKKVPVLDGMATAIQSETPDTSPTTNTPPTPEPITSSPTMVT